MRRWRGILFRVSVDGLIVLSSMMIAYWLRFEFRIPASISVTIWRALTLAVVIKIPILLIFRVYRFSWRNIGLGELSQTAMACASGTAVLATVELVFRDVQYWVTMPRSILGIDLAICLLAILGVRVSRRLLIHAFGKTRKLGKRTLVVGAGDAGSELIRALEMDDSYAVVGLLDDDPAKSGLSIRGVNVTGTLAELDREITRLKAVSVLIAMPSAPPHVIRETIELARSAGIQDVKIIPQLSELYAGIVTTSVLRDVCPEDVLRRDPVRVDTNGISSYIMGRTALVTGAAGSIGTELCRQLLKFGASRLVALDFNETGLFYLESDLNQRFPDRDVRVVVADVRDTEQIERILRNEKPYAVYHAAAYKHVPMMEAFPCEAVKTNIEGTRNVLRSSCRVDADAFVLISTDKAVSPTSVMGTSKRIAELMVRDQESTQTRCMTVRFGNVLGSRGSVLKTFQDQVEARQPITVTHPDMERFFMVTSEAVQLVLQASVIGQSGQVLVLDMGKPVRIVELAEDVIRFYGLEPNVDLPIVFSGIRPGEKLFEELMTAEEGSEATSHKQLSIARMERPTADWLTALSQLVMDARGGDDAAVMQLLRELVPQFQENM
ncbi:polysaccharide biosynthesis protein [Candidatus Bipolaricaulota bacterium]|nr:polysaccharide biosynthesis protein [Candidatus Bipolaricaulota bacterium]